MLKKNKHLPGYTVAIIGAGAVGSTVAYATMIRNIASEVILIDVNLEKEEGEVMDIGDGLSFVETARVVRGKFKDAARADIVVVTAGFAQKPGETRLDLIKKNTSVIRSIFKATGKLKPTAILIMVTNPVDVLTLVTEKMHKLPPSQVFGSGTVLDTARLKVKLGSLFGVSPQSVDGFVLGEHGDSEFVAWSTVRIGGKSVYEFGLDADDCRAMEKSVRSEAYEIINRKGATFYGIGITVADIIEAIVFDQHKIMPVSTLVKNWNGVSNVCLGVPAVVGRSGVEKIWPLELPTAEQHRLAASAKALKQVEK